MNQPALAITDTATGARIYKNPRTMERVPSVTTILGNKDKPALVWWSAGLAAEWAINNPGRFPQRVEDWNDDEREAVYQAMRRAHQGYKKQKADVGSDVHALMEAMAKGEPLPEVREDARPYVRPVIEWANTMNPQYVGSEVTVWSERHEYAGTLDSFMRFGDNPDIWLMDTKTGNDVYPETCIQLAALGKADYILHPNGFTEPIPEVAHYGILHVIPDHEDEDGNRVEGKVVLHTVDHHIESAFEAFVGLRQVHRFKLLEEKIKKELQGG